MLQILTHKEIMEDLNEIKVDLIKDIKYSKILINKNY